MPFDIMPWIEMALRWLHVITGIAWIGSSFYFVWLDNHLVKREGLPDGVAGELWAVHGGGFYNSRKYLVAPPELPPGLHWFKYEAYFTWISGFLLLGALYYYGASIYLIDTGRAALTPWAAIGIGLAFLAGGWLVYDGLCRSKIGKDAVLFFGLWFAVLLAAAYALTHLFSGRGAFIHVGAMIGTVMVGNVFFIIIPNQKKAVAEMIAGRVPEARLGLEAKQRSLHNNYMTLPVLLVM
ncbi:MAG TPA: urate hydroxylase PuuD, partial [Rhizomicrobium sp.]|nr:urate hydroxylase PuuD [Rhizomicrobium sp.]